MARRFRNAVGPLIRRARVARGWSQDQLAAKLQLAGLTTFDRVTVAKVESQIRSLFDFELLVLAHVLELDSAIWMVPLNDLAPDLDDLIRGEK